LAAAVTAKVIEAGTAATFEEIKSIDGGLGKTGVIIKP
jgi:hypothetical protein